MKNIVSLLKDRPAVLRGAIVAAVLYNFLIGPLVAHYTGHTLPMLDAESIAALISAVSP